MIKEVQKHKRYFSSLFYFSIFFTFILLPCNLKQPEAEESGNVKLNLTIDHVIRNAVQHNLDVQISRYDPAIAKENIDIQASAFDTVLSADINTSEANIPSSNSFSNPVVMSKQNKASVSASKLFEYGTTTKLSLSSQRDSSTSSFTGLNPSYTSSASLEVTQPLLKNRGTDVNTAFLVVARNDASVSRFQFAQKLIDTVTDAQSRYWSVYAAKEEREVQEKSLKLAEKFLKESKLKVKVGTLAPIDTLAAEAEVAARKETVIIAENNLLNSVEDLITYIYGKSFHPARFQLLDKPEYRKVSLSEPELTALAFKKRNDYLIAKENVESSKVNLVYAKNQTLPKVDLYGTLSLNGLSGQEHTVISSFGGGTSAFIGNYDKSVGRAASGDYYSTQVGISIEYPWNLRKDKARYRTAMNKKEKALARLLQVEQQILLDVRTGIRNVSANDQRYHSASIAEKLAEEKLLAEEKKFNVGLSTSYNVLQFQRDLTTASVNRIKAAIDYQRSLIELDRIVGVTLEKNNIDIASAISEKNGRAVE